MKQHSAQQGGGGGASANDLFSQFFGSAFGGGAFGGFGGGGGQAEEEGPPKGATVTVELRVSLADLYLGRTFAVTRDKGVYKPAKGTRQCNCKVGPTHTFAHGILLVSHSFVPSLHRLPKPLCR